MMEADNISFERVASAIGYLRAHFKEQPTLEAVARQVHLSPFHFQRLFTQWAGTSPKKFLQYLTTAYAKQLLQASASLFEATHEAGLSSTSRLHEHFMAIEGMTPATFKQGGKGLKINYSFANTPFGQVIVASTHRGICQLAFCQEQTVALASLQTQFPQADFQLAADALQQRALSVFQYDWSALSQIKLHLKGSPFQLKVWEALLKIPFGQVATYGQVAHAIGQPGAARAVGSAIGSNPIAYLIPCHRVIQQGGEFGGYMWGPQRKAAIIGWEAVRTNEDITEKRHEDI